MRSLAGKIALAVSVLTLTSCSSWYYSALEAVGTTKRELFKSRVVSARDAQEDAKEQFTSALERFKALRSFDGGKLEETYEQLDRELQESESQANTVHTRIDAVESVATALFEEWEAEIDEYTNKTLQHESEKKFREAHKNYNHLMRAMRAVEDRLDPALSPMRDQVLFLKHNLNAKAIASLEGELQSVEVDVASLIKDLQKSIAQTDEFIRTLEEK